MCTLALFLLNAGIHLNTYLEFAFDWVVQVLC